MHFYPQQWEKGSKVQWREVMKGRILVAQVELDKPTWIVGAYSPHEGDKRSEFWQKIKELRREAADKGIQVVAGGDWNAVPNPEVDRQQGRKGDHPGDKLLQGAMRGWEDVTCKSGWTYTDSVKVWSRIDSWWVSQGVKATMDSRTGEVPAPFTRHRGVGIEMELEGGNEEGRAARKRGRTQATKQ